MTNIVNAPGLVSPSFWLVAQGSISVAKLDIALFDRDKDHAVRAATRMVQSLHPAGYYMFSLCDATGAHLLAEFVTNQPALEIVVKRCD